MSAIKSVRGQIIHDSRGDETVQVTVELENGQVSSAAVPAGASKSSFEAKAIEPKLAVQNIASEIEPALIGKDVHQQAQLDQLLIQLDGTKDKGRLGANAILGTSLAVSRAAAQLEKLPLYRYIGELDNRRGFSVPLPMMNVINGGKHADNNLDFQEFMIVPDGIEGYHNQLSAGKLIFSTLGEQLRGEGLLVPIGDEGGYAPNLDTNEMAMEILVKVIKESGYKAWDEVSLALDIAASSLPDTFEISASRYLNIFNNFPVLSLEDPFGEDDWKMWNDFRLQLENSNKTQKKLMIVGDDIYATNPERLERGIREQTTNAILVKLNQIGTLSETINVVDTARKTNMVVVISHRSGETLDDYIADLAVGVGAQFIKTGAPNDAHPERMVKYRRLLEIEAELHGSN